MQRIKTIFNEVWGGVVYYFKNEDDLIKFLDCCKSRGARPAVCAKENECVGQELLKNKSKEIER